MILVEQVQDLYRSGHSVASITKKLHKSNSNISRWCRKILDINGKGCLTNQEKRRQYWYNFDNISIANLDTNYCRTLISLLYWCEGAKYPATSSLAFTSSDVEMQKVFIKLLRKAYPNEINESKIKIVLQIPSEFNVYETINYWSNILNIPTNQFYKPHITSTKGNRFRTSYHGTCSLRYHDYRLLLRIMGSYNQISKQIINE